MDLLKAELAELQQAIEDCATAVPTPEEADRMEIAVASHLIRERILLTRGNAMDLKILEDEARQRERDLADGRRRLDELRAAAETVPTVTALRRIARIEIDYGSKGDLFDVTFYFSDTGDEPFSSSEFTGITRLHLEKIENAIHNANEWLRQLNT
jgi:hypothetical protein